MGTGPEAGAIMTQPEARVRDAIDLEPSGMVNPGRMAVLNGPSCPLHDDPNPMRSDMFSVVSVVSDRHMYLYLLHCHLYLYLST